MKKKQLHCKPTLNVIVPTNPALTITGSLKEFNASAFSFKSLRTTSPLIKNRTIDKKIAMWRNKATMQGVEN